MKKLVSSFAFGAGLIVLGALLPDRAHTPAVFEGQPVSVWIQRLTSGDYQTRSEAAEAIQSFGMAATPDLILALHQGEDPLRRLRPAIERWLPFVHLKQPPSAALVRERAAEQLGLIARTNETALRALVGALNEPNPDVLSEIQRGLRRMGSGCVPEVAKALRRRNARIRRSAAEILLDLGPASAEATPALLLGLKDRDEKVRGLAAQALGATQRAETEVIVALTSVLADAMPLVRRAAAGALGGAGVRARAAVPSLRERLSDADAGVRVCSAQALWRIEGKAEFVVTALISAIEDRAGGWQAPFVLGEMGTNAQRAVSALIQAMKRERVPRPLRSPPAAAFALGRVGLPAVPALIETLRDSEAPVRMAAAIALGFIGPSAEEAVPHLLCLLKDGDLETRQAATLGLAAIVPHHPALGSALVELAHDDDMFISSSARRALQRNSPDLAGRIGLD